MGEAGDSGRRAASWARRRRVLLVEDDPVVRYALRRVLVAEGFVCQDVGDAEAAGRLLAEQRYELVVTDVNLPDDSGLALLARIRTKWPELPVLLISGEDTPERRSASQHLGAGFLAKPFAMRDLLEAIRKALEQRSARSD